MRQETGGSINSDSLTSGRKPHASSLIGDQHGLPTLFVLSQEAF